MRVVVAVDGSTYSRWALNWVARLPWAERPRVTALHVLDIDALRAPFAAQAVVVGNERFFRQELRRMEKKAAETLSSARRQMAALKLKGTVRKLRGAVASVLLKETAREDGLLVVGSHGLGALDRLMLGSVSTYAIHHASCPVLVVKSEAEPLRKIALAVDGSASSGKAVDFLKKHFKPRFVPQRTGAPTPIHVTVIHVMPFLKYPELKEAGTRLVEQYSRRLVKAGFSTEAICRLGKPDKEIMKIASGRQCNLIVMGAKGRGAIARFLLGSVSTKVIQRVSDSVLVVR